MTKSEQLRGVSNSDMIQLSSEQLIMLALGVLLGAEGVEDEELIKELLRRGKPKSS
jgi:hypothetical protein